MEKEGILAKSILWLRKSPRNACFALILAAAAIVGAFSLIQAGLDPYDCKILPDITIGGLDVGGMTRSEARKALKAAAEETLLSQELTVVLPKDTIPLSPADTRVKLNAGKAVRVAYRIGRDDSVAAEEKALGLLPYLTFDDVYIQATLKNYALQYDTELSKYHYELIGTMPELSTEKYDAQASCPTLQLTLGTPKAHLDQEAVFQQILAVYDQAIAAARDGTYTVSAEVIPEALPEAPDLAAIQEECCVAPVNDALDMQSYAFVPGSYGCGFDPEDANRTLEEADWGETVSIPMAYAEPEILGDEVYFRDVLGSCETRHTNDENRNTNLRLLCAALDGVVLQPGDTLSYNETVGERTEEKGYKPANAYSGNRLVKSIGGGVCQGSTTLYNCALLADLEVLERVCHGAKVGYVPLGLDAAVNWATNTDLKFRNNFHFPIMIRAEVADGYVKMQILGTDEKDYYIEMHCGVGDEGNATYAVSYKYKYSKETGELISKDVEARSAYYTLSE